MSHIIINRCINADEDVEDETDESLSFSTEPRPIPDPTSMNPQKLDYMLQSWEMLGSTSYKTMNLCLEHLSSEGESEDEHRELLRLGPQPLFEGETRQAVIAVLLEGAFKTAARLSNQSLFEQSEKASLSVPGIQTKKPSNTKEGSDRNMASKGT